MTYTRDVDAPESLAASGAKKTDAVRMLTIYCVLLFLIPSTQVFAPLGAEGTPAVVFSLCVLLWYLASWFSGRIEPTGGGRLVRIAMLIFAMTILASFVAAMTRDITSAEALAADMGLVWLASAAGLVIVITETIRDYDRLEVLLRRLVIFGTVVAAIGVLQFRGIDLTKYIHIPGLSVNTQLTDMSRGGFLRPQSTTIQPIEFSVIMSMLLPFAVQQAFNHDYGGWLKRWGPVALMGFAVPITGSRSGIIGLTVGLLIILPTWKLQRILGSVVVIGLGIGALRLVAHGLVGNFVNLFAGIFNGQDGSANARIADYSGVAQYIDQRPLFGRGFGTFLPLLYRFTDNMYLHEIVELGIVGIIVIILVFLAGIQSAALGRRRAVQSRQRDTGQALVASIAIAMTTSYTFDSFGFPMFCGLFFMLLGCCGAYSSIMTVEARRPSADDDISYMGNKFAIPLVGHVR
jgi:hypothetical protein